MPEGQRPYVPAGGTIPSSPEKMPDSISYDADAEALHVGDGSIVNVSAPMWEYRVSGTHVVREWFNDRRKDRTPTVIGDRTISPLWEIHSDHWRTSYTTELLDLLNVVGLLAVLEPNQDAALSAVVASEIWTVEELTAVSVLPVAQAKRAVHIDQSAEHAPAMFDLDL